MEKTKKLPNGRRSGCRGYTVAPDLLPALQAQLDILKIEWAIVEKPEGHLGGWPRPILVTASPGPPGWRRFGRCPLCRGPRGLCSNGQISGRCQSCRKQEEGGGPAEQTSEQLWRHIEHHTPSTHLGLPAWFADHDCRTVNETRDALRSGEIANVGPERALVVSTALIAWRSRVLDIMAGG